MTDATTVLTTARLHGWDFTFTAPDTITPRTPEGITPAAIDLMRANIKSVRSHIICRLIVEQWMAAMPEGGFTALTDEQIATVIEARDSGDAARTVAACQ